MSQIAPEIRKELDALEKQRSMDRRGDSNTVPTSNSAIRCHTGNREASSNSFDLDSLIFPPRKMDSLERDAEINKLISKNTIPLPESRNNLSTLVHDFPKEIDGGKVKEVVSVNNPVMRVIHIKQTHSISHDYIKNNLVKFGLQEDEALSKLCTDYNTAAEDLVQSSQSDIKKIELDLIQNHKVKDVYIEGLEIDIKSKPKAEWTMKNIDNFISFFEKEIPRLEEKLSKSSPSERKALEVELTKVKSDYNVFKDTKRTLGATGELYQEGHLEKMRPFEHSELLHAMVKRIGTNEEEEYADKREDLSLIEASGVEMNDDGVAVVVLGRAHEYENNIRAWNNLYPDKQIALTEITPNSSEYTAKQHESLKKSFLNKLADLAETQHLLE